MSPRTPATPPPIQSLPDLAPDPRPLLVFVCDSLPPYRVRVHRRAAAEIPGVRVFTICTHDPEAMGTWPPVPQADLPHAVAGVGLWPPGFRSMSTNRAEWRKAGRIAAWLARHRPAAVIVNGYADAGRLRLLAWCRRRGVPGFTWGDSNVMLDTATGLRAVAKRAFLSSVVRLCFGTMPYGHAGVDYFLKYGARRDRVYIVPMEPDYDLIDQLGPDARDRAAADFALAPGRRRVIYCGRLAPEKRVDVAIAGFAAFARERPEWDLLIVGGGPRAEQLRAAVPPDVAARVIWTGPIRDSSRVFALFAASDVMVLASTSEPWALVVNEAVASGLAVVCTRIVGAAREMVRDGENGRLVPVGDPAAVAAALAEFSTPAALAAAKEASRRILAEWRRDGDPVMGIRQALADARVLPVP